MATDPRIPPYGVGTPMTVAVRGGAVLRNAADGTQTGSRRIDARTRDYVIDAYGRTLGMPDVHQLVLLALRTTKGSAAMRSLGHELGSIAVIGPDIERRVEAEVAAALKPLVDRALVELVAVTVVRPHPGAALIRVQWRDVSADAEHTLEI